MQLGATTATGRRSGCSINTGRFGQVLLPCHIRRLSTLFRPVTTPVLGPGDGGGSGGDGKGPERPQEALRKLAQQARREAAHLIDCLTPKQEYDFADVTLILLSTLVFMWLAACMYRLYAYCFYVSGHQSIGVFFGGH